MFVSMRRSPFWGGLAETRLRPRPLLRFGAMASSSTAPKAKAWLAAEPKKQPVAKVLQPQQPAEPQAKRMKSAVEMEEERRQHVAKGVGHILTEYIDALDIGLDDDTAEPETIEVADAYSKIPGRYWKVGCLPNNIPVFRQEAVAQGAPNN